MQVVSDEEQTEVEGQRETEENLSLEEAATAGEEDGELAPSAG